MKTLGVVGRARLAALCEVLDLRPRLALAVFNMLSETWGDRFTNWPVPSTLTDDGTPFEFSVAFGEDKPELRILAEAQGYPATPTLNRSAALRLTERIGAVVGLRERSRSLVALAPERAAIWHAAALPPGRVPLFKLYFNPAADGLAHAAPTTRAVLSRLGHAQFYTWLQAHALRQAADRLVYISLDLVAESVARTKVYVAHDGATAAEVEQAMSAVRSHVHGDAVEICEALAPGRACFDVRPLLTCYSILAGESEPSNVTLHVPVSHYVESDAAAVAGARRLLSERDGELCERAAAVVKGRPLDEDAGTISYVSCRRVAGQRRTTVYLAPCLSR